MDVEVEDYKKQHLDLYKNAVMELIKNNTDSLIENDIISLIKKPPLDSMDVIKTKLISLAKTSKVILNSEELDKMLEDFRRDFSLKILELKKIRNEYLQENVKKFDPVRDTEIIKIPKKDIDLVNRKIKKIIKEEYNNVVESSLLKHINLIYSSDILATKKDKITESFSKYVRTTYFKQLLESFSIKTLVKDRILISGISEQGERYLFTKSNSHIFD